MRRTLPRSWSKDRYLAGRVWVGLEGWDAMDGVGRGWLMTQFLRAGTSEPESPAKQYECSYNTSLDHGHHHLASLRVFVHVLSSVNGLCCLWLGTRQQSPLPVHHRAASSTFTPGTGRQVSGYTSYEVLGLLLGTVPCGSLSRTRAALSPPGRF